MALLKELTVKWAALEQNQALQAALAAKDEEIKVLTEELAKLKTDPAEKPPDAVV
jgi:hypothetical protein